MIKFSLKIFNTNACLRIRIRVRFRNLYYFLMQIRPNSNINKKTTQKTWKLHIIFLYYYVTLERVNLFSFFLKKKLTITIYTSPFTSNFFVNFFPMRSQYAQSWKKNVYFSLLLLYDQNNFQRSKQLIIFMFIIRLIEVLTWATIMC